VSQPAGSCFPSCMLVMMTLLLGNMLTVMASWSQEEPEAARRSQEEPEAARRSQVEPEGTRRSYRMRQEEL
jgi:3-methyladenine DNA glycosylase AlkC